MRKEVVKASSKDQGFVREFDRLKERGDSEGLSRHVKNFGTGVTPGIVQRVAKLFAVKPKGAGAVVKTSADYSLEWQASRARLGESVRSTEVH